MRVASYLWAVVAAMAILAGFLLGLVALGQPGLAGGILFALFLLLVVVLL
jgi:hypothetical protein